jgi:carbon monoxide dehydrogenase subunit G
MAFQIEKTFAIHAPAQAVWDFLTDPRRVARAMPGAAITGQLDEKTYAGTMAVKVGPVQANYKGQLRFEQLDPAARMAVIAANGQDVRGKGGANMRLTSRVVGRGPGETEVTASSEVNVTGVLAQFGRGMIQDVSDQLFVKFTEAMRVELEPRSAAVGSSHSAGAPAAPEAPRAQPSAVTAPAAVGIGAASSPPSTAAVPPAPLDLGALGTAAAGRAVGRAVRRPGFWVAAGVIALLLWWLFS